MHVDAKEAGKRFAELLQRAKAGETVTIVDDGEEIANLTATEAPLSKEEIIRRRKAVTGSLKGQIWMADDFNDPLPDDMLKRLYE